MRICREVGLECSARATRRHHLAPRLKSNAFPSLVPRSFIARLIELFVMTEAKGDRNLLEHVALSKQSRFWERLAFAASYLPRFHWVVQRQ